MPPRTRGLGPSVAMAVLVHAALIGALTWGIAWKRDPQTPVIAAELWAALIGRHHQRVGVKPLQNLPLLHASVAQRIFSPLGNGSLNIQNLGQ